MIFWGCLYIDCNLLRSLVCLEYWIMIFWGHLSLRNTRLWPLEVIFLCGIVGYDLCEVIFLCGIPDYDLLRSFVHAEYQWPLEVIFLHGIVGYDLCKVICLCGIPDYDLLRSFVRAEYPIVTSWGHISVWDSGLWPLWGHFSVWNTRLWSFEVVCPCRIPDCDLLRSYFCMG